MPFCCDYDALTFYKSGEFNTKYKTVLTGKVREIEKEILDEQETESFLNGKYRTYITTEEIVLYRIFGEYKSKIEESVKGARNVGRFLSTEFAESPIDAKIRLALNPTWKNIRMYEAKVLVPKDIKISVGVVAPIYTTDNTKFEGGADQVYISEAWDEKWIVGYRRLSSRQIHTVPKYPLKDPGIIILNETHKSVCPMCCDINTVDLREDEQFTVLGSKGGVYTMKKHCLNEDCGYYW